MSKWQSFVKAAKIFVQICGGWWSIMSGAISIPFAFVALLAPTAHQKEVFAALAFVALWVFVIRVIWKNYQSSQVELQMEIIPPDLVVRDILTGHRTYRVRIKNRHPRKLVKNLTVSIHRIEWPSTAEKPLTWSGIIFPRQLPEKGHENVSCCELAGVTEKEFDLMFVHTEHLDTRMINLAPFRPTHPERKSIVNIVDSDTSFSVENLPKDDSNLVFTLKVSGGDGDINTLTESYILKVPPCVTENSIAGAVEKINTLGQNQYLPVFEKINP